MYTAAIITVSDKASQGLRQDTAGPAVRAILGRNDFTVAHMEIIPDEQACIEETLIKASDTWGVHVVFTVGGTGFSPRDVTPEATKMVCERMAPGIPEAMRIHSAKITNRAMLSRAAAGIRGQTLIINLPGSEKAARENLEAVMDSIPHGLDMLLGRSGECARRREKGADHL